MGLVRSVVGLVSGGGGEMNELALFAGAGGGILGGQLLGWRTVCAVENDAYAASILVARQNDGCLEPFPVWDDVRTFNGKPWRGVVDVVSGGFPCQDISAAGGGAGISGSRSGLWVEFARVIYEVRPRYVFVENSPVLTSRGLGEVLGDLAEMGYDAEWGVLGAHHADAPHKRDRIWVCAQRQQAGQVAYPACEPEREPSNKAIPDPTRMPARHEPSCGCESMAYTSGDRLQRQLQKGAEARPANRPGNGRDPGWWESEPNVGRVADGVAARVDRLRCVGNGQVPAVAAMAWGVLSQRLGKPRATKGELK